MEAVRRHLAAKFSSQPSESDVAWAYLNKELVENAALRQWGLYRNVRLSMGGLLDAEGKQAEALTVYLEVCYIDINGPVNRGTSVVDGQTKVGSGPDFSPDRLGLATGVLDNIAALIVVLSLKESQVREVFLQQAALVFRNLNVPIPPEDAWKKFDAELSRRQQERHRLMASVPSSSELLS